jgi:hypothetical protein
MQGEETKWRLNCPGQSARLRKLHLLLKCLRVRWRFLTTGSLRNESRRCGFEFVTRDEEFRVHIVWTSKCLQIYSGPR